MNTRLICIQGQWYVYVAGPFSTLEAAEQRQREVEATFKPVQPGGRFDPMVNPFAN